MSVRCRDCGSEIGFVTLRSGKRMPVESAEPEEYRVWLEDPRGGLESRQLVLVTGDGTVLTVYQGA